MRVGLKQSGGYYATLLRASDDAQLSNSSSGTFYAIEVANPQISGNSCVASLNAWRVTGINSAAELASTQINCYDGMVVRNVMAPSGQITVFINGIPTLSVYDTTIASGIPGVAVVAAPTQNSISLAQLGALDTVAPNAIAAQTVGRSMTPSSVNLHWPGVSDNPNGVGLYAYQVYRHDSGNPTDVYMGTSLAPQFADETIPPSSSPLTYTYTLQAIDYHLNIATTVIQVTPPAAGFIDPRQIGVRPTGSYWGGGGEQIDMRSGNLNFTIPILKANGRGWSVPFNLSANSQLWRQDPGGTWNFGVDTGFGYGWKMQGGSLAPVYAGWFNVDHFLFTDVSGAEYRLDVNTNGIWTSRESIYVEYDSNAGRLYFPDGTFWAFGCTSGGTEQDAGTSYPTLIQDSNGNQITIAYAAGQGTVAANSSGRMTTIQDVMGTYNLTYTEGWAPHISTVASVAYPAANYTFRYWPSANLTSPFDGSQGELAQTLKSVINTSAGMDTELGYTASGELNYAIFPYGGELAWYYGNSPFAGGATLREVGTRALYMSAGAPALIYPLTFGWASGYSFNTWGVVADPTQSQKQWYFGLDSTQAGYGLQYAYREVDASNAEKRSIWPFWTFDGLGRPYLSSSYTLLDRGLSTQVENRTDQVLDQYGNATSISQYDFGAPSPPGSPTRVYTNVYLTDSSPTSVHPAGSNYNAEHIHNRLLTSTVTLTQNGQTTTTTLANNLYDFYNPNACQTYGQIITPTGWGWGYAATGLDPNNTANVFRGNVTTSFGLDMRHDLCYATTGAVFMRTDGGHVTSGQTSSQTNYTAPSAITTGSLTTSMNWTGFLGLAGVTGPNGDASGVSYDAAQRPASTSTPYGSSTTYSYSINPPQTTAVMHTDDANTNGRQTVTKLDGFGRTLEVDTIDAHGATQSIVQTQYAPCACSPLGKVSQVSQPHAPGAAVYWTKYTYDGIGRTQSVLAADAASATAYAYAGNIVTVTDAAGKWKKFTMDTFGNLTSVAEPDATQTNTGGQATTTYTYDALNHLIGVSMPRQMPGGNTVTQTRTFTYSGAYMISAYNPENGTVNYTYNADGTLATKQDMKGQAASYFLQYVYDLYGRVTTVETMPGTPSNWYGSPTVLRTYTYDVNSADGSYSQNALGRLTTAQYGVPSLSTANDSSGRPINFSNDLVTEMYSYSVAGQVAGKRLRVARNGLNSGGSPVTIRADLNGTWSYNNEGHLTGAGYPGGGPSYSYSYNGLAQLSGMTGTDGNSVGGVSYNAAGQMLTMNSESRSYNAMGQLTGITASGLNITYRVFVESEQRQDYFADGQFDGRGGYVRIRFAEPLDLGAGGRNVGPGLQLRPLREFDGKDGLGGNGADLVGGPGPDDQPPILDRSERKHVVWPGRVQPCVRRGEPNHGGGVQHRSLRLRRPEQAHLGMQVGQWRRQLPDRDLLLLLAARQAARAVRAVCRAALGRVY